MSYSLRCPVCRQKFRWKPTAGFPEECPACETRIAHDRDDDDVVVPFIKSAATSANDALYRQMESASERRVEMAAQASGATVEEMAGLKITDLNSTRHAGDIAAVPVNNQVSQLIDSNPGIVGFQRDAGLGYSSTVSSGPFPNAGARMQSVLREGHAERMSGVQVVTSDRPALETQSPNYRRRV